MMMFTRKLTDVLFQSVNAVACIRVVLYVFLRIHVLGRKVCIPVSDASKYGQCFFDDIVNSSSLFEMAGFLEGEPRIARKY